MMVESLKLKIKWELKYENEFKNKRRAEKLVEMSQKLINRAAYREFSKSDERENNVPQT